MAALAFFGYLFLGVGPGLVFWAFFIAPKSFLVLLSITSTFIWLVVLLAISAIFRGFVPVQDTAGSYAGVLVASVLLQEACRYGLWLVHRRMVSSLELVARNRSHRLNILDKLYLALAWGYGHGACHVLFFFVSLLPLTTNEGTFYADSCPQMSIFLASALNSLAFGMVLTSITVVALEGYHTGTWRHILYAPAMHMLCALVTLGNFRRSGCVATTPTLLALGVLNVGYAVRLAWQKGARRDLLETSRLQPM